MLKKYFWLFGITLLLALVAANCTGAQPQPKATLSVQSSQPQAGPQIIAQDPIAGQRLDLAPTIKITFDRAMDKTKTTSAWSFLGPDGKAVSGQSTWLDTRTFQFIPDSKLQPAAAYKAVISTDAIGTDGKAIQDPIELKFTTVEALAVTQVFPAADAEDMDSATSITVIFNRPIVPATIAEEQSKLPQPLEISPAATGAGQWVNSSVYVFQPDKALLTGTRYTVRIEAGLKDVTGNSLDQPYIWQFSTRAPTIANFALKDGEQNPGEEIDNVRLDQSFVVTFMQPMDKDSLAQAVTLVNRETRKSFPIKLDWNKDLTVLTIAPVGRYQIASFYDLNIATSARAADGGTLKDGLALKLSTVPLPKIISVTPTEGSSAAIFDSTLSIKFASPMNFASTKGHILISPPPKTAPQWYYSDYDWSLNSYSLEPATNYVVRILPGITDIYGNAIQSEYSFSFKTGDMLPSANLVMPWTPLVYRAKGPQEVNFEHTNLSAGKISLYQISFNEFGSIVNNTSDATKFSPTTQPVREWMVDTTAPRNQTNRLNIKLQDRKGNSLAPGYYFIGVTGKPLDYKTNFYQGYVFVVATDNITFKATNTEALAWVVDLESGQPQANVPVIFYDQNFKELGKATTDKNGLSYANNLIKAAFVQANGADHLAFAALNWGSGVWAGDFGISENYYDNTTALPYAYLYTERPVYRPGQAVYFKGIVRSNDDLHYSLPTDKNFYLTIEHWGEKVYSETVTLSDLGSFGGDFKLADDAALGSYDIFLRASSQPDAVAFASLSFRVADYHKPQFQVNTKADAQNLLVGDNTNFTLDATYYSGGNVANGKVDWFTEAAPYIFQPSAKFSQFNFTDWDQDIYWNQPTDKIIGQLAEGQTVTDQNGHAVIAQTLDLGQTKSDQQVTFNANVTDVSGSLVAGSTSIIVHQSRLYAGIRSAQSIGKQGDELQFEAAVVDWDSNPVAGQSMTVKFVERKWYSVQEQDKQGQLRWVTSVKDIPVVQKDVVTGADGIAKVSFIAPHGGVFKAIAVVQDKNGHTHQSSTYIWVASNEYISWQQTNDRSFKVIADKDMYSPGDTAQLLIAQPFQGDVYALVTYERGHIYKQDVVLLNGNSTIYKLPITDDMAPMAYISVTVVSGAQNSGTPDFKIGMTRINVDTSKKLLNVQITSDKKSAGPGDSVTYTVTTKDSSGKPVSADVSLAVVDKAVLALAPSNSDPILKSFYPEQALGVHTALGLVSSADEFNANYRNNLPEGGGQGGGGGGDLGIITVRQDFKDTAFFKAQLTTDSNGTAQVTVKLPENLTTWVTDVRAATADSRVGQARQELVSTKPLFVELQTPRFFVAGDSATVGAIIHNNGESPLKVDVSLEAQGVDLKSDAKQTIDVPAKQQGYVTWDLNVQSGIERVDLTANASSGSFQDSSKPALGTLSDQGLPVLTYTAVETVGTSGILSSEGSITESLQLPTNYNYTDTQLNVEASPSLASSMESGLTYLEDYPYLCMEQTTSRVLSNVITTTVLKSSGNLPADMQTKLESEANTALQRIYAKQLSDGGWTWWDGDTSDANVTAYVVYGLLEAKDAGYAVSDTVLTNGVNYLKDNILTLGRNDPTWRYNRQAFMLYVLARAKALGAGQTNFIYENRTSLSLYGEAYLAQTMYLLDKTDKRIASLMSDLGTATVMSASGAHWEESGPADYWNWNTDTRTTSIVLDAFIQIDPNNSVTANAVRWLMSNRESGHWKSTQETSWSLKALADWLGVSKENKTNYAYAIGLNGVSLKQGNATTNNLTETTDLQIGAKDLLKAEANYLVFTRGDGAGNLYYTAYLKTTLPVEEIKPLDQGVSLSRQYFALDDPKKPITEIQRGQLVRVRLTVVASSWMHYIVVNDPLPAGLEAVDASIATDTKAPEIYTIQDYNDRGWGWWFFDHTELRDEKVVLSANELPAGTYVYTYLARASTAGTFKVIPPTASEFYFPDVGGRGAGSVFVVKP
jgi:hypothetical protein